MCTVNMKWIFVVFLVVFLGLEIILAEEEIDYRKILEKEGKVTVNMNDYIDELLETAKGYITDNNLDPIDLPKIEETFEMKKLMIDYSGKLSLFNGKLSHIKEIARQGNVLITYDKQFLTISTSFIARKLLMQYNYLAQVMNIGPTGQIFGNVKNIVFSGVFAVDTKTMFIQMKSFKITSIGQLDVTFSGNSLTDPLINSMLKLMTTVFKDQLKTVFSEQMKFFIQKAIEEQNRKNAENLHKQAVSAKKGKKGGAKKKPVEPTSPPVVDIPPPPPPPPEKTVTMTSADDPVPSEINQDDIQSDVEQTPGQIESQTETN